LFEFPWFCLERTALMQYHLARFSCITAVKEL